ncbi:hypothetical protein FB471_2978 [Amycolatopsis cihanbeyliensis]|uniref:Uncharacterized protein n=1 Tax=Amycolatopsis cihanbeyliensis TaxID=1128664 RepID=A0A542DJI3_AMYCI|nr:hypothetical protein FB471_2978 [Amycolatopsis cihanbeyliensis]
MNVVHNSADGGRPELAEKGPRRGMRFRRSRGGSWRPDAGEGRTVGEPVNVHNGHSGWLP